MYKPYWAAIRPIPIKNFTDQWGDINVCSLIGADMHDACWAGINASIGNTACCGSGVYYYIGIHRPCLSNFLTLLVATKQGIFRLFVSEQLQSCYDADYNITAMTPMECMVNDFNKNYKDCGQVTFEKTGTNEYLVVVQVTDLAAYQKKVLEWGIK